MKRILFIVCVLVLVLSSVDCIGPMGAFGGLYTDITSPDKLAFSSVYQITPELDFEAVAYVEGQASGVVILGLIATGNFGYGAAIEDALSKAPGATRLVDVVSDTQVKSFFMLYTVYTTKVRGRAIKIKEK